MEKLIPNLRFPEFNDVWIEKTFSDIYSFKPTNSYSRDNLDYEKGSVKNIHYGDIHTKFNSLFDIEKEKVPFIKEEINISRIAEDSYIKEGDLVIADASEDYNDIGKMIEIKNLNNEQVIAGLHTFLARKESNSIALGFSSFLMKSWNIRYQIMKIAQGTKVLSLSSKRVADLKLIIPKTEEQQKIVTFLTAVDNRIELLEKQKEQLTLYKKGVMQQLFSQKLRFKDDNGNNFLDWKEKKLEDFCSFFSGGTPTSTNSNYYIGDIPFIGSGNIYDSEVFNFISKEAFENSSAKLVKKGDLLYALYGANSGDVSISKINGAINQAILCIRNNECIEFLYYLLSFNKENIVAKYLQGGQGNLSAQIIKKLHFKFPLLKEQQKIASFLSTIDVQIELVSNQIEGAKEFKKGLLQQMFV